MRPRNFSSETKIREFGFLHEVGDGTSLLLVASAALSQLRQQRLHLDRVSDDHRHFLEHARPRQKMGLEMIVTCVTQKVSFLNGFLCLMKKLMPSVCM
jgi:hypothetical protein